MATLLSPRRNPDLALRATVAEPERVRARATPDEPPRVGWLVTAVGGGLAVALTGWIVVCGLVVTAWLTSTPGSMSGAMGVGTQFWLLANGASARLGASTLTLVPLGVTWLVALLLSRCAAYAGRQATKSAAPSWRLWAAVAGVSLLSYAVPVLLTRLVLGVPPLSWSALVGAAAVLGLGAGLGSCRGLGYSPTATWPGWCRAVLRAVLASQLALVVTGAAVLVTGLLVHVHRVGQLTTSLHPGWVGVFALWLAQAAWLPNAVVWAASYGLGAGFSLGAGTSVAPVATQLGLLPSVPLFGALPHPHTGDQTGLWWLASGVLAGCVAAWLVFRGRPILRADLACLLGGLSGVLGALVFTGAGWTSSGDLGTARLAGLGPRLLPLLVLSVSTLGLSAMLSGFVLGLSRWLVRARARRASAAAAASPGPGTTG